MAVFSYHQHLKLMWMCEQW